MKKRSLRKALIFSFTVLTLLSFVMFQFAYSLIMASFIDRLDEKQAVALRCSFEPLTFESEYAVSNITGEKILLLNVTFQTQKYQLYSENLTSNEVKYVGGLEKKNRAFLIVLSSEMEAGKEYLIDGKFADFYKYGTVEPMQVLFVESYHEPNILEKFVLANKLLFSQIAIALVVFTTTCILALIGSIILIIPKIRPSRKS